MALRTRTARFANATTRATETFGRTYGEERRVKRSDWPREPSELDEDVERRQLEDGGERREPE